MPVRPMLLHRMALVSFRLFCKNLVNLQEFFGQMDYRSPPPWQKIGRTPMLKTACKAIVAYSSHSMHVCCEQLASHQCLFRV